MTSEGQGLGRKRFLYPWLGLVPITSYTIDAFPAMQTTPGIAETKLMLAVARLAKAFPGRTPIHLANDYGLFKPEYYNKLSPEDLLLIDLRLLVRLSEAEQEALNQEKQNIEDKQKMPGLVRRLSMEELIERQRENKDMEVQ